MIQFKTLKFKNLLSYGNYWTEYDLSGKELTVVVGKNGSGKSTFLDALNIVLYNKSFRQINKPQLVNSITKKDCLIEITFSTNNKDYRVVRGIKPNIFEIYEDGNLLPPPAKADDYQTFLEDNILKCNQKAFCQVVVLGSASYVPFLELPSPNRRQVVENLLDLEIFSLMNTILKSEAGQTNDELIQTEHQKQLYEVKLTAQKENEAKNETFLKELETKRQNEIDELKSKSNEAYVELNDLRKQVVEVDTSVSLATLNDLSKKEDKCDSTIKDLKKEIAFYEEHENCPVCAQVLDSGFKNKILAEKKEKLDKMMKAQTKLDKMVKDAKQAHADILIKEVEQRKITRRIDELRYVMSDTEKKLNVIYHGVENPPKFLRDDNDYAAIIAKLNNDYDDLSKKKNVEQIILRLLKDDGIKSKIIEQYIGLINQLVNEYLLKMDFLCQFQMDSEFNETIKSRYRDTFTFQNFSQGEKLRITLAILFTWREIAKRRNSISTNLLIFDEILDSSLDIEGVDGFLSIIKTLTKGSNTFIISHNPDAIQKIENVIEIEKVKGFSHFVNKVSQ